MPKKLMTLAELSEYIQIREEKIIELVEKKVIVAYKIGGELLRFRKEHIDATLSEINSRVADADKLIPKPEPLNKREKLRGTDVQRKTDTFLDRVLDFFYFNDFYILSGALIAILLFVILFF